MEHQSNKLPTSPLCKTIDRKTIEKNRRNQMKDLYFKLNSLVPHQNKSRGYLSLPDQLEETTNYIKKVQIDLEKLRVRKENLTRGENSSYSKSGSKLHVEINNVEDSVLEIVLITGLDNQFMFNHIIRMLHEEGVQVINANYSVNGDTIFHSIHSKVGEIAASSSEYGASARIITEKLKQFVAAAAS